MGRRCPWATVDEADPAAPGPLFPQLRPHRKGVSREQVVADQRARICGAMVEAVARRGYQGATVAEVARLAGVSTRTVYERFDSKEGCLLAACEAIAGQAREKVLLACDASLGVEAGGGGDGRPRLVASAWEAFAQAIERHPKEAAFVLVHAPTAGAEAYRRIKRAHALCAEALAGRLEQAEGFTPSQPLLLGAVHGVSHVARTCLIDGRARDAVELLPALQGWVLDCVSPLAADLGRGRDVSLVDAAGFSPMVASARSVGESGERASKRLPRIAAEIAASEGYRAVSVARICDAAQIDVDDFFAHFESPEDCLLAARELLSVEALASALQAVEQRPRSLEEWCDALSRALTALLVRIAADDALQAVGFLEPIGSEGAQRRVAIMGRFAEVLMKHARRAARFEPSIRLGRPLSDAAIGAFWGIVQEHVMQGQARRLPSLAAPISYLVLCPIVGPERALETGLRAQRVATG